MTYFRAENFQKNLKELMVKKEEDIAERREWRCRDKDATTKSFVDLQEWSVANDEAIAKARVLEVEAKTKALESEAKPRLLEAEARTKLLRSKPRPSSSRPKPCSWPRRTRSCSPTWIASPTSSDGNGSRKGKR
jgi:hypothetical protein